MQVTMAFKFENKISDNDAWSLSEVEEKGIVKLSSCLGEYRALSETFFTLRLI